MILAVSIPGHRVLDWYSHEFKSVVLSSEQSTVLVFCVYVSMLLILLFLMRFEKPINISEYTKKIIIGMVEKKTCLRLS